MHLPRWLARFNSSVSNRAVGLVAPYLPPLAVVRHRGRRSGTPYRAVVLAWRRGETVVIGLWYGETDWYRHVLAAGGGELVRLGHTWTLSDPHVVRTAADLPAGTRWNARVFDAAVVARIS